MPAASNNSLIQEGSIVECRYCGTKYRLKTSTYMHDLHCKRCSRERRIAAREHFGSRQRTKREIAQPYLLRRRSTGAQRSR